MIAACSAALMAILIAENKKMERDGVIPKKGEEKDGLRDRGTDGVPKYR